MPRVISGSARGTRLVTPRGNQTRPTGDKVKEAMFSILMPRLPADGFLDLYAGTGQIGLEAASRGSKFVVLVEKDESGLAAIRTNLEKTHLAGEVQLLPVDIETGLRSLLSKKSQFDLIFLDPPYQTALADFSRLGSLLAKLVRPDGLIILEHDSREKPPAFVTNLQLVRSCQYGTAMLSFYQLESIDS